MKCVERADGSVVRIEDKKAHEQVLAGKAKYVPKRVWKEKGRQR